MGGCLLLCSQWASLADIIQLFPNLRKVHFPSTGTSYYTQGATESDKDELVFQEVLMVEDGVIRPPQHRCLPQDLDYRCWYHICCLLVDTDISSLIKTKSGDDVNLVEVLLLPAYELFIWNFPGQSSEWRSVLWHRAQRGIPTRAIKWKFDSASEMEQLAQVVPKSLRDLTLMCSVDDFNNITQSANTILDCIDSERFPSLRTLRMRFDCPKPDPASGQPPSSKITPAWMQNDMPPELKSIEFGLTVYENENDYDYLIDDAAIGLSASVPEDASVTSQGSDFYDSPAPSHGSDFNGTSDLSQSSNFGETPSPLHGPDFNNTPALFHGSDFYDTSDLSYASDIGNTTSLSHGSLSGIRLLFSEAIVKDLSVNVRRKLGKDCCILESYGN